MLTLESPADVLQYDGPAPVVLRVPGRPGGTCLIQAIGVNYPCNFSDPDRVSVDLPSAALESAGDLSLVLVDGAGAELTTSVVLPVRPSPARRTWYHPALDYAGADPLYIYFANPHRQASTITVTYFTGAALPVTRNVSLGAQQVTRFELGGPLGPGTTGPMAARVDATVPIGTTVSRFVGSLSTGDNVAGVTQPRQQWFLLAGATSVDRTLFLANPGAVPADVTYTEYVGPASNPQTVTLSPQRAMTLARGTSGSLEPTAWQVDATAPILAAAASQNGVGLTILDARPAPALDAYFPIAATGDGAEDWVVLFNPGLQLVPLELTAFRAGGADAAIPLQVGAGKVTAFHVTEATSSAGPFFLHVSTTAPLVTGYARVSSSVEGCGLASTSPARDLLFSAGANTGVSTRLFVGNPSAVEASVVVTAYREGSTAPVTGTRTFPAGSPGWILGNGDPVNWPNGAMAVRLSASVPVVAGLDRVNPSGVRCEAPALP
ncbi:MAG: hypothetical protein HY904_15895 [Deltaproteobacteria bacterium]|nr:hypothetical protein [Deltaproteobacteria bacterium]